jgi:hypothetical protein
MTGEQLHNVLGTIYKQLPNDYEVIQKRLNMTLEKMSNNLQTTEKSLRRKNC